MNKAIHDHIKAAMDTLLVAEQEEIKQTKAKLPEVYKGYLSSLGASMRMSGLIPTLAFFSSRESSAKGDRWKVLDWIARVLNNNIEEYKALSSGKLLFEYSLKIKDGSPAAAKMEKDILDASVALKLCIRTFELVKK
jgi:CRISPR/Cas system CMR-associated protein Cmr5 small subunit